MLVVDPYRFRRSSAGHILGWLPTKALSVGTRPDRFSGQRGSSLGKGLGIGRFDTNPFVNIRFSKIGHRPS
jgi:hypothetical protein